MSQQEQLEAKVRKLVLEIRTAEQGQREAFARADRTTGEVLLEKIEQATQAITALIQEAQTEARLQILLDFRANHFRYVRARDMPSKAREIADDLDRTISKIRRELKFNSGDK